MSEATELTNEDKELQAKVYGLLATMNKRNTPVSEGIKSMMSKMKDKADRDNKAHAAWEERKGKMSISKLRQNQTGKFIHLTGERTWSLSKYDYYTILYNKIEANSCVIVAMEIASQKVVSCTIDRKNYKFLLDEKLTKEASLKEESKDWLG